MEFTEECLTVFWIYVHVMLNIYNKIARILYTNVYIFKVIFNQESWQSVR